MFSIKSTKNHIKIFLTVLISAIILFQLSKQMEIELIYSMTNKIEYKYIFLFFIFSCFASFLTSVRFCVALKYIDFKLNILDSWSYVLAVAPFNLFIPSKGGEFGKAYLLRSELDYADTVGSVIIEKYFDIVALNTIGLIGAIINNNFYVMLFFILVLIIILSIPLFFTKKTIKRKNNLLEKLINIFKVFDRVYKKPQTSMFLFLNCLSIWISFSILIYLVFNSIKIYPDLNIIMFVYPISIMVGMIPMTLSGLGTRDAAFIFLFGSFGIAEEAALIVSLFYFLFSYILPSVIGIPFSIYFFSKS